MSLREQLSDGLARLAALSRQEDWRAGEAEGLTPTQADILRLLIGRSKGVRLSVVASHLQVAQPTASDAATALERKGLAEKISDPEDGRAVLLRATIAGRALSRRWPLSFGGFIDTIPASDQATMLGIVSRAILSLEREGRISSQRMCLSCRHFSPDAHPGSARPHHCKLIGAPIGAADLRIDCPEHEPA